MSGKIYTRSGDDGSTRRLGGESVRKSDAGVEAIGSFDELSAFIGYCLAAAGECGEVAGKLAPVQRRLFEVCSVLAALKTGEGDKPAFDSRFTGEMEKDIDAIVEQLPPLADFVAPGGCELAARLHVARTICRRAERRVAALADGGWAVPLEVLAYVNRLSDFLFVLARLANRIAGRGDNPLRGE